MLPTISRFSPILIRVVDQILEALPNLPQELHPKDRSLENQGGYLTLEDFDGNIILISRHGDPAPEKNSKYKFFSDEKAGRLLDHPDHISSYQSRTPEEEMADTPQMERKYGGAIRIASIKAVLSFSGLPELLDEALVTVAVIRIGRFFDSECLSELEINEIAAHSDNPYIKPLLALFPA